MANSSTVTCGGSVDITPPDSLISVSWTVCAPLKCCGCDFKIGQDVEITLNQAINPALPVSVKGIVIAPLCECEDSITYWFKLEEDLGIFTCHIVSVKCLDSADLKFAELADCLSAT